MARRSFSEYGSALPIDLSAVAQWGRVKKVSPRAIHRYPTEAWSVEELASRIGVSRSSFAARFMSLVGEPPMQYVRQWRFHVATRWLEDSDTPIADIAERLDYNSEAAFGRAFKKFTGKTPGAIRRGDDSAIASVV